MKFKVISLTALLAACLCWSCSFNSIEDDLLPEPIDICDPTDTKYCSNNANGDCHFSGASIPKPDYTAYAGIKQKIDEGRIQARLFDQNPSPMPPSNSLGPQTMSTCEITLLQRWIAQGAPNN